MLKTYLYIPEQLEEKIVYTAKALKQSKAEVIRQAIEKGIHAVQQRGTASAKALLEVAELGKNHQIKGPKDSSERMDDYLWVNDSSNNE